VTAKTFV